MTEVEAALEKLIARSDSKLITGQNMDKSAFEALNMKANNLIPTWFVELHVKYPFAKMNLKLPDPEDADGEYSLTISPPEWIESELFELMPGCCIAELGYISIAEDANGSGDPYFININEGTNPPVYQIYHDISEEAHEIIKEGKVKIANSLSELLDKSTIY